MDDKPKRKYTPRATTPVEIRIMRKTTEDPDTGCIIWTGATDGKGRYGLIGLGRRDNGNRGSKMVGVHRAIYEALVGPIADGLTIDHLCENKLCVNIEHLEPVTIQENLARSDRAKPGSRLRTGLCQRGHNDWINAGLTPSGAIHWKCRPCRIARDRDYRANGLRGLGTPGYKEVRRDDLFPDGQEDPPGDTLPG